ncbi:MAG: hypothetical protein ACRDJN_17060 [Chloroflexota bacterium]
MKEGIRRGSAAGLTAEANERYNQAAVHRHPEAARALIRAGAARALCRRRDIPPLTLAPPYEFVSVTRPAADRPAEVRRPSDDDLVALLGWPSRNGPVAG